MGCSGVQLAKRAFVRVLLALAAAYTLSISVDRDSADADVLKAWKQVVRKVHPDKGGATKEAQRLQSAKEAWDAAREDQGQPGRPSKKQRQGRASGKKQAHQPQEAGPELADAEEARRLYRLRGTATMLTYNGIKDFAQWLRLVSFVESHLKQWGVRHWCATLEQSSTGRLHAHLFLQFHRAVDRTTKGFAFEGIAPRADPNDLCGEGVSRKKLQESINRGFFYVWADKIGTQRDEAGEPCVAGNYQPVWTEARSKYQVLGRWPETLWKQRKLTHEMYEKYLYLSRDGVLARKRNLDECRADEEAKATATEIAENTKRIRGNPQLFAKFPVVPAAQAWLALFQQDALRYPLLLVLGASHTGKTEWVKSLFANPLKLEVGTLSCFPDGMRAFERGKHDGIILDDVRDLAFLAEHQEKLQGKYDTFVEFATTQGGTCAYKKYLFRVPIAATVNYSTRNLDYLGTHDWLQKTANRVLVNWPLAQA